MLLELLPLAMIPVTLSLSIFILVHVVEGSARYGLATALLLAMFAAIIIMASQNLNAVVALSPIWAGAFALSIVSLAWPAARDSR